MRTHYAPGLVLVAVLAIGGCSSEDRSSIATDLQSVATDIANAAGAATNDVAEALARTIATQQGEEQFKNAGNELDGPLTCEATVQEDAANIAITCTGKTKDGKSADLTGSTNEIPGASVVSLDGDFSGKVDGTEVFHTQRLGG
ncbi:MAG: hypothetical protein ABI894_01620 [Ilumatobacteraceae bacterium]